MRSIRPFTVEIKGRKGRRASYTAAVTSYPDRSEKTAHSASSAASVIAAANAVFKKPPLQIDAQ